MSIRVRLFIHSLVIVLVVIAVMVGWMYRSESGLRNRMLERHMEMVNRSLIYAYEQSMDLPVFLEFIDEYLENSVYNDMQVSIYNEHDSLLAAMGTPLSPRRAGVVDDYYFFSSATSDDGRMTVMSAMPYTYSVGSITAVKSGLWWLALIVTIVSVASVWLGTRHMGASIRMLRRLTLEASSGKPMNVNIDKISHDELGDITRDIINLYNQRVAASERSEREHRIALHAVEEKARIKHQLTNNINHELKTPIGVIRGYLDTIAATPDMDETTRNHFIERSRDNVERLCSLLNDVSAMTRLEDGSENIPVHEVNMHDLLFAIEDDIRSGCLAGDMEFNYQVPIDCVVEGNENLLNGMVLNLVKNAVIHSHGTQMGIRLVSQSSRFYVFTFWDDGVGVPPEHLSDLFERFYRVDTGRSRKVGGTGLGLSIVKKTVVALGGAISVHNRSTGGLEFTFTLRRHQLVDEPAPIEEPALKD